MRSTGKQKASLTGEHLAGYVGTSPSHGAAPPERRTGLWSTSGAQLGALARFGFGVVKCGVRFLKECLSVFADLPR